MFQAGRHIQRERRSRASGNGGPRRRVQFRLPGPECLEGRVVLSGPDLAIDIFADQSNYHVGDTIPFYLFSGNTLNGDAIPDTTPITITEVVPLGFSNVSANGSGNWRISISSTTSPSLITATYEGIYPVEPGQGLTGIPVELTPNGDALGSITTTASVSVSGDQNLSNNIAMTSFDIQSNIQPSTLAVSAASGTYGGTTNVSATLTAGASGVANEPVDFHLGSTDLGTAITDSNGIASIPTASLGFVDAGTYTGDVTASFAGDASYDPSSGAADLTVTPAPLTISVDNQTKVYGQANPSFTATVTGILNGDDLSPNLVTGATRFSDVQAGGYAINVSGLSGAKANDYYGISVNPGTLTVTPAPLTVSSDNQSKVYGQANPTLTGAASGVLNGDEVVPNFSTTATQFSDIEAGGYPITLSALTGSKAGDYSTSVAGASVSSGTLTVTPAPLTIAVASQSKVYGQANPSVTGVFSGAFNGDNVGVTYGTTATQFSDVKPGGYAIVPTGLTGTKAPDYSFQVEGASVSPGTLTITPAPLAVMVNNLSKVYGQAVPALTGIVAGVLNSDNVAAQYSTSATATSHVTAGGVSIFFAGLTGPKAGDYSVTASIPGTLTITTAPLTVTASNGTKVYGQANPTFSASESGFVLGQGLGTLGGSLSFQSPATPASHVGHYAITPSGLTSTDYAIKFVPGSLSVTPATLLAKAPNVTKFYGQPVPSLTASYSGFVNGDTATSLSSPVKLSTPSQAVSGPGVYPVYASGGASADYKIHYAPGTLIVPVDVPQVNFITSLYESLLGRQPETEGLAGWITRLANGRSLSEVANLMYISPEARAARASFKVPVISEPTAYKLALAASRLGTNS